MNKGTCPKQRNLLAGILPENPIRLSENRIRRVRKISLIGIIIKERYCIIEKIGQGGEGQVYLARDMELGIYRAVKVLPVSEKQEAILLGRLDYPSIPKMIDYQESGEYCYIIMEYIHGKTLGQYLREGQNFSTGDILKIGIAAAQILDYLHQNHPPVYYGDMKPDNLMVTEQNKLYLVDFGSAKQGYGTVGAISKGTPGFAAPEQFDGILLASSDVYGLGKTLLAFTGKGKLKKYISFPGIMWVVSCCCNKYRFFRYKNIRQAVSGMRRWQKSGKIVRKVICFITAVLFLISVWSFSEEKAANSENIHTTKFEKALTEITDMYYSEKFITDRRKTREQVTRKVEKSLLQLMKLYPDDSEQKKLLLLLAFNGECSGNMERASLYYEQLILYYPDYQEGYAQYGIFLWENGKRSESRKLWERFCRETQELGEEGRKVKEFNVIQWEKILKENGDEKK